MKPKILLFCAIGAVIAAPISSAQAQSQQAKQPPRWMQDLLRSFPIPSSSIPLPGNRNPNTRTDARYGTLTQERAALGLSEALSVGTANAVTQTGRVDGFFRNELIKILMPEKLRPVERTLRAVGAGRQVDEFVLGMNRAAERAAPQARSIFGDAIRGMSFSDVWGILRGGDTAATDYFRSRTEARLAAAFRPVVSRSMDEVGATRQYKAITSRYGNLPFLNQSSLDIDAYVVDAALDGLFKVVAQEEREIRRNPIARITPILRDVFGR